MSTATVLAGTTHQHTGEPLPTHLLRLSDRSRPGWFVHSLMVAEEPIVWLPHSYDRVFVDLLACVAVNVIGVRAPAKLVGTRVELTELDDVLVDELADETRGTFGLALAVTIWPSSSLHRFGSEFRDLPNTDVELLEPTWSRQFNHWGNEWSTISVDQSVNRGADGL